MKPPLLTVCLITYNQVSYIHQALETILGQETNFSWQLIIADDYSTDGTREVLLDYKSKYPNRINLLLQKQNVGPERNWLDLLSAANTEYVLYCEGDDYFTDLKKFQVQIDFLKAHKDFTLCFHPVTVTYEDGFKSDEEFPTSDQLSGRHTFGLIDLLERNFMQANSVMYRWRFAREDIRSIFPQGIVPGDWFLHLLHAQEGKIGFINRRMAVYRRHKGGIWWNSLKNQDNFWQKYGQGHVNFFAETLKMFGNDKKQQVVIYRNIVNLCTHLMEADQKRGGALMENAMSKQPHVVNVFTHALYENSLRDAKELDKRQTHMEELAEVINQQEKNMEKILHSRSFRTGYLILHPWKLPSTLFQYTKHKW